MTRNPLQITSMTSEGETEARGDIRRMAVLMEMADGTLITLYSESGGEVTLSSEVPTAVRTWGADEVRRSIIDQPVHGVHVEGLTSYAMTVQSPDFTRAALTLAKLEVEP